MWIDKAGKDPLNPQSPQLDRQVYPLANEKWPEVKDAVEASEKLAGEQFGQGPFARGLQSWNSYWLC